MKRFLFITALILSLFSKANNGDTIVVQTFTFGSPQDAWFVFPSDTVQFEKILMLYTLKCNPAQSPACGEWDYLTYTYLYKNTGLQDSSLIHQPIYTVNGSTPATVSYMNTPSYSYDANWQYYIVHSDTSSLLNSTIGSGSNTSNRPFGAATTVSKSQYLWKASEMTGAGMSAGNISGLQFFIQTPGSTLQNLTIKIKSTTLDSITNSNFSATGFSTVYSQTTSFTTTGWNSLQLNTPFNWNGTSNLIIEISYNNTTTGTDNIVNTTTTAFTSGIYNATDDRVASFHSTGYIEVPMNNKLVTLDSFVTVAYWAYGTPEYQPQDGTCFEAIDSLGNRILNSHMPWSDSQVYWDAGFAGTGYDRINKAAITSEIEGQWNHWAFTKNVATGSMKIYLNGNLWHSATAKTKPMKNIKTFKIGKGNWSGSQTYEGKIDEFTVFNTELSQATIQAWMNKSIDASHPNYNNLALYYKFNDGNYISATDNAPGTHTAASFISTGNPLKSTDDIINQFTQTSERPNIVFEQGVFTSHIDSVLVVDSTLNTPIQIVTYNDSINNPGMATDTMIVWPQYYTNYLYDAQGNAIDSTLVSPDSTLTLTYYDWYKKFPQVIRYELGRYITPYGNGLNLGSGWTWTFDVSDYRTLLADSVHLSAGNWQELLEMKFLMIKGTPPRNIVSIQNLWNGQFDYGHIGDPIENHLTPKTVNIPATAQTARWKSRITGHGMDTPSNCAEFCPKYHYFKVDGTQQFSQLVWRDNCDLNPLYPQGGTWVYDRANWCPGAEVWTYDFELTPFITPGNSVVLDHDVQPYTNNGEWSFYQIEDQLVTYGSPNFTLDASLEEILSPSKNQMWQRFNTICTDPVIKIKNTGSTPLTSLTITYGLNGATPSVYNWTGNLAFMESATVKLGNFNWMPGATDFNVTISNPNGGSDQYSYNNTRSTKFTYPQSMPSVFFIEFRTNNYPWENQYTLKDESGNIILQRNSLTANTLYRDTVNLANGCYEFELTDSGEDGLSWWANTAQGSGYVRFKNVSPATTLKTFGSDFGGQVYQQFTVGLATGTNDFIFTSTAQLSVFPNPSSGQLYVNIDLPKRQDVTVYISDVTGKQILKKEISNITAESLESDLSYLTNGIYFVQLKTTDEVVTKKFIKN